MGRRKGSKKRINMVKVRWSNDNEIKNKENTCPNKVSLSEVDEPKRNIRHTEINDQCNSVNTGCL